MTNEHTLADAIAEVKRVTEKSAAMCGDPKWSAHDFADDPAPVDHAIARIMNAVVAGGLVPPATECPFGDDCVLTVAYMAGAASKKNASMMTASELAADDKDATIARLTAARDKWRNDCLDANASELSLRKRAERAEAKLAEVAAGREAVGGGKVGCGLPCGYDCNGACFTPPSDAPADDRDATIARLTEQVNTLTTEKHADAEAIGALEAKLAEVTQERYRLAYAICGGEDAPGLLDATTVEQLEGIARKNQSDHMETIDTLLTAQAAGTFAQGIDAAAGEWQNVRVEGGVAVAAVMAYSDRIRALAPQAVDVRDTPTQAQQAGLSDAKEPQADPVREAVSMARQRLEAIADQMMAGSRDGGLVAGRELKRSLSGVFAEYDAALRALAGEQP